MVVYADILVFLNFLVDYFLLSAVGWALKLKIKVLRYIIGAFIGGISSLYIFIPISSWLADFGFKFLICLVSVFVTFGFKSLKKYFKALLFYFGITCLYAGIMIAFWHIFKPLGMTVKNSVVYFNISPIILIFSTVIAYLIFIVLTGIFKSSSGSAEKCDVRLFADGRRVEFTALIDSGNSLNDVFGKSDIIIADKSVAVSLFDNIDPKDNIAIMPRYRVVPCNTVSGGDVLEGFRCDGAVVSAYGKNISLEKPVLAISKINLNEGYEGIINPEILD